MTWNILFAEILTMKRVRQLTLQPTNTRSWIQLKHLHCDYYVPSSKKQWECRFAHVRRSVCRPNVISITKTRFGLKLCKQVTHTRNGLKLCKQACWFWGHCDLSCQKNDTKIKRTLGPIVLKSNWSWQVHEHVSILRSTYPNSRSYWPNNTERITNMWEELLGLQYLTFVCRLKYVSNYSKSALAPAMFTRTPCQTP